MKKDPLIFIKHILESIKNIEDFMNGISKKHFLRNKEKQNAVIREIEIIGEAAKNIPANFRSKHTNIPWRDIAGMRDKLMHHYFGVNLETVWKVIKEDIPILENEILKIKDDLESANIGNEIKEKQSNSRRV